MFLFTLIFSPITRNILSSNVFWLVFWTIVCIYSGVASPSTYSIV